MDLPESIVKERFVSMLCLFCLGRPEHVKEHEDYGQPWIPTEEDFDARNA